MLKENTVPLFRPIKENKWFTLKSASPDIRYILEDGVLYVQCDWLRIPKTVECDAKNRALCELRQREDHCILHEPEVYSSEIVYEDGH